MLSYISVKEAAKRWNISQRQVAILCSDNRIEGAMLVGNMWIIPTTAENPSDKRKQDVAENCNGATEKEFDITIEETVSKTFRVVALDEESAKKAAIEQYRKGDFVLEPGNLSFTQIQVHDIENNTYTEWFAF